MEEVLFRSEDFLTLGLTIAGFTRGRVERTSETKNLNRFRDFYYADPATCENLFQALGTTDILAARIEKPKPCYLLLALNYLKQYKTKFSLAGFLGVSENTAMKWAKVYVSKIQALKVAMIQWPFDDNTVIEHTKFIISVDGVHCPIQEPRNEPSAKWYSKKLNGAGLSYELGIDIWESRLVWINGPFPAGQNDISIFRKPGGLMSRIPDGGRVVADEGYRGEGEIISTRNPCDTEAVREFKNRVRARHETFNSRLKAFKILSQPFRGQGNARMEKHQAAFEACCVIIQYNMANGHELFKV